MIYEELRKQCSQPLSVEGVLPNRDEMGSIIVGGMGGSALPANALRFLEPALPISIHRDYDLPESAPADALYVAVSYSGNTEETLSFAHRAHERGYSLAVVTSGGKLLELAQEATLPFVKIESGEQPRNAVLSAARALALLLGNEDLNSAISGIEFDAEAIEQEAGALAGTLANGLPIFYAARPNGFLAYAAKVQMNESAKMPSYANVFPELNHNEMQSFDTFAPSAVAAVARFVLLRDDADNLHVTKAMTIFTELMRERSRNITEVMITSGTRAYKLVRTWYLMHRTACELAKERDIDPDAIPLVEEFKKRI